MKYCNCTAIRSCNKTNRLAIGMTTALGWLPFRCFVSAIVDWPLKVCHLDPYSFSDTYFNQIWDELELNFGTQRT